MFTVLHDITLHCTWLGMCELLQSEPVRPSVSPVLMSGGYDAYNSWVRECYRTACYRYGGRMVASISQQGGIKRALTSKSPQSKEAILPFLPVANFPPPLLCSSFSSTVMLAGDFVSGKSLFGSGERLLLEGLVSLLLLEGGDGGLLVRSDSVIELLDWNSVMGVSCSWEGKAVPAVRNLSRWLLCLYTHPPNSVSFAFSFILICLDKGSTTRGVCSVPYSSLVDPRSTKSFCRSTNTTDWGLFSLGVVSKYWLCTPIKKGTGASSISTMFRGITGM